MLIFSANTLSLIQSNLLQKSPQPRRELQPRSVSRAAAAAQLFFAHCADLLPCPLKSQHYSASLRPRSGGGRGPAAPLGPVCPTRHGGQAGRHGEGTVKGRKADEHAPLPLARDGARSRRRRCPILPSIHITTFRSAADIGEDDTMTRPRCTRASTRNLQQFSPNADQ